ncbi:MAG TPA: ribonuclease HII [Actinomycetes bacterium]|nr:ribonuclease HII [Actinomycetes bacterium]
MLRESGELLVAGVDEVGRGALGGPVSVGVVVVDLAVATAPRGLRDSKLLTPNARGALVPRLRRWARAWAVGHASAAEIDELGILCALRLAGERAFADLPVAPRLVLLDGSYDWLTRPTVPPSLFDDAEADETDEAVTRSVTTLVKADLRCASVAAASVLAKTTRDALMVEMAHTYPAYGWESNKGYASVEHLEAMRSFGVCEQHRRSWNVRALAMREDDGMDVGLDVGLDLTADIGLDDLLAEQVPAESRP